MKIHKAFSSLKESKENVQQLLHVIGVSRKELANTLNVSPFTLDAWAAGRNPISKQKWNDLVILAKEKDSNRMKGLSTPIMTALRDIDLVAELENRGWEVSLTTRINT